MPQTDPTSRPFLRTTALPRPNADIAFRCQPAREIPARCAGRVLPHCDPSGVQEGESIYGTNIHRAVKWAELRTDLQKEPSSRIDAAAGAGKPLSGRF